MLRECVPVLLLVAQDCFSFYHVRWSGTVSGKGEIGGPTTLVCPPSYYSVYMNAF
jgi:hypothetical protein